MAAITRGDDVRRSEGSDRPTSRDGGQRRLSLAVERLAVDDLEADDAPLRQPRGVAMVAPEPEGESRDGPRVGRLLPVADLGPVCADIARRAGRGARG